MDFVHSLLFFSKKCRNISWPESRCQCHAKSYNCRRKFPHHKPWAWKALISVNVEDGILVQDGKARTARGLTGLENYSPPAMQQMTIPLVSQRVSDSMETQEVHPTIQDNIDKNNSSTWRCETGMRKSIGGGLDKQ